MKAATDVAHQAGKRISIHSYGPDGARDAVRAGADSVEHATDMDDATIAEMARSKGPSTSPPWSTNRYYIAHREGSTADDQGTVAPDWRSTSAAISRPCAGRPAGVRFAMGRTPFTPASVRTPENSYGSSRPG